MATSTTTTAPTLMNALQYDAYGGGAAGLKVCTFLSFCSLLFNSFQFNLISSFPLSARSSWRSHSQDKRGFAEIGSS